MVPVNGYASPFAAKATANSAARAGAAVGARSAAGAAAALTVSASWPCSSMSFTEELTSEPKGTKGIIAVIGHSNSLNGMKMMKGRVVF